MSLVKEPTWLGENLWLNYGARDAPMYDLIEDKFIAMPNRRKDISSASMIGRAGIKAVLDTSLDKTRFEWTHSKLFEITGKPNVESLTREDVEKVASSIPLCFAEGDELMEGIFGSSDPGAPHFRWFYAKRAELYAKKGLPYRGFGTYGSWAVWNGDPWETKTGDGSQKQPNHPFFKAMVASKEAARRGVPYFDLFEPLGLGAFIKHYADSPIYASRYYNKAFAAERMSLGMGSRPGVGHPKLGYIDWYKVEQLGGDNLHNGFAFERKVNGQVIRTPSHPHVDFNWQVGNIFCIGFCRTGAYVLFDERDQFGSDPNSLDFPPEPLRGHDAGLVAGYYYNECRRTAGEPWRYSRYRLKGSEQWIEPQTDNTTILEHASANDGAYANKEGSRRGRTDCMFRDKTSSLDIWGFDPSRPKGSVETIIANPVGDVMIEMPIEGCKLALYTETI